MKFLDKRAMKYLSFPDFDVENMELSTKEKTLKVFIAGAWLDIDEGSQLGRGILYFSDWEKITISRFDPQTEEWLTISEVNTEPLKDLCEVQFADSDVSLCGFSTPSGHWVKWNIQKAKMRAEFAD